MQARIEQTIVQPVLTGMAAEGNPFRGFLYCGLMLTPDGPKVIEFNVRFGDPEAQVVMPLIDGHLRRCCKRRLKAVCPAIPDFAGLAGSRQVAVGVVLAAHGYPGDVRTGDVIHGLDDVARDCPDVQLFYAGVKQRGERSRHRRRARADRHGDRAVI